jgi:3-mercaptopyruvate sulfurtransferase SseA
MENDPAARRIKHNGPLDMRSILRIAIILLAAMAAAAAANAIHPRGIAWFVTRDVIYPPPTPEQAAATISRDEVLDAIRQGATVVDARKAEHFQDGRIPGAINVPSDDPASPLDDLIARALPEDPVIIYCGGDPCDDSKIVFERLKAHGYQNIRLYFGGWQDWIEANLDVEK